ncbi:putative chromatin assembly factor 1 subunit C [Tilletiaria anomala UBC 951]|uniref:Putative chromatin assembly factor 1 subunit C n=1 Tax=Tilletiaria anomala (strain ATCC 24038 / CBS 436.72 / UBC 951) TaxID=1037660 RepID=A0A066WQI4_TILAU|nr:putative chromatin assembly factor 1 subunit C [Tilletiaria anomala UBC 951]KDN52865.1 putative chromatin assembly factor 1 subunit C [Tilletiaria anomala UBC 951]
MSHIDMEDDEAAANAAMISNEEYKIWKKNSPFLYDLVVTHALEWPTLTTQWFPDKDTTSTKGYSTHRILLGTHTSGQDQNYLQIAQVQLPLANEELDQAKYDDDKGEIGSYGGTQARVKIIQRINHDGEINRARYCPQNPDLIATRSLTGATWIFDRTKHSSNPAPDGKCRPDIILTGQKKEGYGLAWNVKKQGEIIAASEDTTVAWWDINKYQKGNSTLEPLAKFKGHSAIVEDCAWHNFSQTLFVSVGDDRQMLVWDTRETPEKPKHRVEAHTGEVNAVAFSPANEYILCTGSSDKTVRLWDLRNLKNPLHALEGHTDEILSLAFSPTNETVLASASADRRVNIWDLSLIGAEQTPDDAEDGPPELLFQHGGHTARPTDICWSPHDPWHMVTAAEDNVVQIWRPSRAITEEGDIEKVELE